MIARREARAEAHGGSGYRRFAGGGTCAWQYGLRLSRDLGDEDAKLGDEDNRRPTDGLSNSVSNDPADEIDLGTGEVGIAGQVDPPG